MINNSEGSLSHRWQTWTSLEALMSQTCPSVIKPVHLSSGVYTFSGKLVSSYSVQSNQIPRRALIQKIKRLWSMNGHLSFFLESLHGAFCGIYDYLPFLYLYKFCVGHLFQQEIEHNRLLVDCSLLVFILDSTSIYVCTYHMGPWRMVMSDDQGGMSHDMSCDLASMSSMSHV